MLNLTESGPTDQTTPSESSETSSPSTSPGSGDSSLTSTETPEPTPTPTVEPSPDPPSCGLTETAPCFVQEVGTPPPSDPLDLSPLVLGFALVLLLLAGILVAQLRRP